MVGRNVGEGDQPTCGPSHKLTYRTISMLLVFNALIWFVISFSIRNMVWVVFDIERIVHKIRFVIIVLKPCALLFNFGNFVLHLIGGRGERDGGRSRGGKKTKRLQTLKVSFFGMAMERP